MATFYYMRHGECQANVDGVYAGWNESPLTTSGSNAARNEAVRLRDEGRVFTAIYSSPLSRSHQTAVYIAEELGFDPNAIVDIDDLREKHNGTFEGRSLSELFAASDQAIVDAGGETAEQFAHRVLRAVEQIKQRGDNGDVLIVSHSGWYKMLLTVLQSGDVSRAHALPQPPNNELIRLPPLQEAVTI